MTSTEHPRMRIIQQPWFWPIFICLAIAAVFGQVIGFDFINFDDEPYVLLNDHINTGFSLDNIKWAFTEYHSGNWHPVTWLSHMLDVELYGLNAGGHHTTNLLFHTANSLLLFCLLQRFGFSPILAATMTLLFALHPTHAESVAWVSERKDVLSTFFLLLTLLAYMRYARSPSITAYSLVFVLMALGLMSKSMLMTLPFLLILLDYYPLNRISIKPFEAGQFFSQLRRSLLEKIPLFILVAITLGLVYQAQDDGSAVVSISTISLLDRSFSALIAYSHYVWNAILPSNLAMLYPHPGQWPGQQVLISGLFIGLISLISLHQIRARPYLFVGWFWFLGTLVPVIGFIQIGNQYMADRYTYVPYIGLFMALVPLLHEWLQKVPRGMHYYAIGCTLLISFYSVVAFQYTSHWRNSITLYTHTLFTIDPNYAFYMGIEESPSESDWRPLRGTSIPYFNLGVALASGGHFEQALFHFERAVTISPDKPNGQNNRALILSALGRTNEAIVILKKLTQDHPNYSLGFDNLLRLENGWKPGSTEWQTLKRTD